MSDHASDPSLARRPLGSGDEWVVGPDGQRFWGKHGSAGLLVHHPDLGVLLQLRATWSHFGGTWGLPGGARHEGESAVEAAIREADEEAGVPASLLRLEFDSILNLGFWSYTTVVAAAVKRFDPVIGDAESAALRWVAASDVTQLPLHPGFAASWPGLQAELGQRVVLVVDSANVVGSRPNGWWKDRLGATERFAAQLTRLAERGIPASELDLERDTRWPQLMLVVEGRASAARVPQTHEHNGLRIVRAPAGGDQTILDTVRDVFQKPTSGLAPIVFVVTADRELTERVQALGARVLRPNRLWQLLDAETGSRAHSQSVS